MSVEILCVGNSITIGNAHVNESAFGGGTTTFVGSYTDDGTSHGGVAGDETSDVESRIVTELGNFGSPDKKIVLLHVGTNDITQSRTEADIVDNVEDIIDLIDSTDSAISVYVALIIPRQDGDFQASIDLNDALETMLTTYQGGKSNLYIVDQERAFIEYPFQDYDDVLYTDSVHPNALGYSVMADAWGKALNTAGDLSYTSPTPDPYEIDSYTTLLLHADNNYTDFSDSPQTVTNNGTSFTTEKVFGTHAIDFTGGVNYITIPGADFVVGQNTFTLDFWIYFTSISSEVPVLFARNSPFWLYYQQSTDRVQFLGQNFFGWGAVINTWYHFEAVRCPLIDSFRRVRIFIDGVQIDDDGQFDNTNHTTTDELTFGANFAHTGNPVNGYMDEIRFSKGIARHFENFTPNDEPYGFVAATNVTVTPDVLSITSSIPAPSILIGTTVTPNVLTIASSIPTPSVSIVAPATPFTRYTYSRNQITAQKADNFNDYLWLAFAQNTSGICYIEKKAKFNPNQTYYSLEKLVTEINALDIDSSNLYVAYNDSTLLGEIISTTNPLTSYTQISKGVIAESPVDVAIDGSDLWFLLPGDQSGSNTQLLKYNTSGVLQETVDLSKSGLTVVNAKSMSIDANNDIWIVTNTNPATLVRVFELSGGVYDFAVTEIS